MAKLRNHYTATSVEVGDAFAVIVTCYVTPQGGMKFYRCQYPEPDTADGIPQGMYYGDHRDNIRLQDLFPTIRNFLLGE